MRIPIVNNIRSQISAFKDNVTECCSYYAKEVYGGCIPYAPSRLIVGISIAGASVVAGIYLYRKTSHYAEVVRPRIHSIAIQYCSRKLNYDYRPKFRKFNLVKQSPPKGHPHPTAAHFRNVANASIDSFIHSVGYNVFSESMSQHDVENGNAGTRHFHHAKDLSMDYRDDTRNDCIIKFVDVDYYVNMWKYLSKAKPMVIYTFDPLSVGGTIPDGCFTIAANHVVLTMHGGATYQHQVWDFDTDCLTIDFWWGSVIYLVEFKLFNEDKNRRLIYLEPVRVVYGPLAWCIPGKRLQRRHYGFGAVNCMKLMLDEPSYSLGLAGENASVTIKETTLRSVMTRLDLSKQPSLSDVERIIREEKIAEPIYAASILLTVLNDRLPIFLSSLYGTKTKSHEIDEITYQSLYPLVTEDGKPSARMLDGPVVIRGAVAPARSYNNDVKCVEDRILKVRNPNKPIPARFHQYRNEFCRLLVPDDKMHTGVPWQAYEVEECQTRPTQKAAADKVRAFPFLGKFSVSSFQKAELYAKIGAPRNISTVPADHRLRYSSFIYPFTKNILKNTQWYAFAKTPEALSKRLHEVCRGANYVIPTDYTKFDGTHGLELVTLEQQLGLRYFAPEYHSEFSSLHGMQFNAPAFTKFGVKYNTEYSRLSGSGDTSAFNSIDNAFIAYCCYREAGHDPNTAYSMLGIYGGDDGVSANIPVKTYDRVASIYGLILKAETILPGHCVPFLGRLFIDPWTTSTSICDVLRTFRRVNMTVAPLTVPDNLVYVRRAECMIMTDPTTPLVSHWARMILRVFPDIPSAVRARHANMMRSDLPWFGQYEDTSDFFYNEPSDLMWTIVAKQFDMTEGEIKRVCIKLDKVNNMQQFRALTNMFEHIKPAISIPAKYRGWCVKPE